MSKKKIKQAMADNDPLSEEFIYLVKKCGGSSHISLGKRWLNKRVRVFVEEVKE